MKGRLSDDLRVFSCPVQVMEDESLSVNEKMVYMVLRMHVNPMKEEVFPSHSRIARFASVSKSTVKRALEGLLDKGYISKTNRYYENKENENRKTSNLYKLYLPNKVRVTENLPRVTENLPRVTENLPRVTENYQDHLKITGLDNKEEEDEDRDRVKIYNFFKNLYEKINDQVISFLEQSEQYKLPANMVYKIGKGIDVSKLSQESIDNSFKKLRNAMHLEKISNIPNWMIQTMQNEEVLVKNKIKEVNWNSYGN